MHNDRFFYFFNASVLSIEMHGRWSAMEFPGIFIFRFHSEAGAIHIDFTISTCSIS